MKEELKENEGTFRLLFEQSADAMMLLDGDVFIDCNLAAIKMFGCSDKNKLLSLHPSDLSPEKQPDGRLSRKEENKRIAKAIEQGSNRFEWLHQRINGDIFPAEVLLTSITVQRKEIIHVTLRDITDRKRAVEALKMALSEVEKLKNRLEEENLYLQNEIKLTHNFEEIIGKSEAIKNILGKVEQVAATDSTVLILGETGTGKELIARAVHNVSGRSDRPLVKVNCAALPANIIESELFGHEKGAFTGAYARKIGRFELANRGTIFLDEIGDLPLDLQVKLLRVLQDGEFERLGNPNTIKVDIRIIAATNRDLEQAVENSTFREDLYYRLNVFPIRVPSLRERKEDIPFLVNHFIKKFCKKIGRKIEIIPQKVMDGLLTYDWPGNIRELENIIERAVIVCQGKRLETGDWLPQKCMPAGAADITTLKEVERAHILKVLESTRWQVSGEKGAAKILGLNPQTLVSRMKKLGIRRN